MVGNGEVYNYSVGNAACGFVGRMVYVVFRLVIRARVYGFVFLLVVRFLG